VIALDVALGGLIVALVLVIVYNTIAGRRGQP
jgi:hypothetical protein